MTSTNIIEEFQTRRRKTLRAAGPWMLGGVALSLGAITFLPQAVSGLLQVGGFLLLVVGLGSIIKGVQLVLRHYRCPACGCVPKARYGLFLGLKECPTCGAKLK